MQFPQLAIGKKDHPPLQLDGLSLDRALEAAGALSEDCRLHASATLAIRAAPYKRGDPVNGSPRTRRNLAMPRQLGLFDQATVTSSAGTVPAVHPGELTASSAEESGWDNRNWRFGPGREVEYLHPDPTSPAPLAVAGGEWGWNPLVPGWRLRYRRPPVSLAPHGETADRHGPKLLPPAGFLLVDRRRLAGRCTHCRSQNTGAWGGPGWCGWSDPRVANAYETEEAAGRRCYGLTIVHMPGVGPVAPLSHYTRWGAGYCTGCGAIWWNDFRDPSSSYYRPPAAAV